jgi:hypothetical protein
VRNASCWRCRYFNPTEGASGEHGDFGECRRHPPVTMVDEEGGLLTTWPDVEYMEWCGEFEEES